MDYLVYTSGETGGLLPLASGIKCDTIAPPLPYCQNAPSMKKIRHATYSVLSIFAPEIEGYRRRCRNLCCMSQSAALSGVEVAVRLETSEKGSASLHTLWKA